MNKTASKVHGFTNHHVSDALETRHPYMLPPFSEWAPPAAPCRAVFFRNIPNLRETLSNPGLSDIHAQEALLILNDFSSTQENKILMVEENLVEIAAGKASAAEATALEAISLIGSLCSIQPGRKRLYRCTANLQTVIGRGTDKMKRYLGWTLLRIASANDGRAYLLGSGLISLLIDELKKIIDLRDANQEKVNYLRFILEIFSEVLHQPEAMEVFADRKVITSLKKLLVASRTQPERLFGCAGRFQKLSLECVANLAFGQQSRSEAVETAVIEELNHLLDAEDPVIHVLATRALAFISIDLRGKRDIIMLNGEAIIRKTVAMFALANNDLREILSQLFFSLAENGEGFAKIVTHFIQFPSDLVELFGVKCLVPITQLIRDLPPAELVASDDEAQRVERLFAAVNILFTNTDKIDQTLAFLLEKTNKFIAHALPYVLVARETAFVMSLLDTMLYLCDYEKFNKKSFEDVVRAKAELHNAHYQTTLLDQIKLLPELYNYVPAELRNAN